MSRLVALAIALSALSTSLVVAPLVVAAPQEQLLDSKDGLKLYLVGFVKRDLLPNDDYRFAVKFRIDNTTSKPVKLKRVVVYYAGEGRSASSNFGVGAALDVEVKPKEPFYHENTVQKPTLEPLKIVRVEWQK